MKIFVYPGAGVFGAECFNLAAAMGFVHANEPIEADVAIAPLLRYKLSQTEFLAPVHGTLIFHPSALPYRRGPDSIKHTLAAGEVVTAVTWFWCDVGLDTGDICEQEVVVLCPGEHPRHAYANRFIPAGLRALGRALQGVRRGDPRRIPQEHALATYDGRFVA